MASRAPIFIQNENLPIFRGIEGKKAAAAAQGPAARAARQERKALGDLSRARKAGTGGKAPSAASVGGSKTKSVVKPSYLSDEEWMKCCEWGKGGIETASFTGNDMQKLIGGKQEQRIRKKVEKALGAMQLSMDSVYDIDVPSEISMVDREDKRKLELDPEFLPASPRLGSRLGELANILHSDLEFGHETFAHCNFDLKLKDDYANDSSFRSTMLLP